MKNLLACFILFYVYISFGQYESILSKKNLKYNVRQEIWDAFGDFEIQVGDSIQIGDFSYRETFANGGWIYNEGYIREDTITGKLWYRDKLANWTEDSLIMDLTLTVGDTFYISFHSYDKSFYSKVKDVSYINGRKVITFDTRYGGGYTDEYIQFIEGIGPNTSFIHNVSFEFGTVICDVFTNGVKIYTNNCPPYVGIKKEKDVNNLPNIVDDILLFKDYVKYQIININGTIESEGEGNDLDVSNFVSGIYLIRINTNSGGFVSYKFVKK